MRAGDFLFPVLFAACVLAGAARAEGRAEATVNAPANAAIFDAVFVNSSPQETSPEETARLQRLTKSLRQALDKSGQYRAVDLAPLKNEIDAIKDIHDCNGCEADLAKKAGAQVAIVAWVQKVSNLIININIRIEDSATGQLLKGGSVDIRGNDDRAWERGLKYLLEERVLGGGR